MDAIQMNTRIDRDIKARGDAVFARYGYTPSQVVRQVWDYASTYQDVPAFLKERAATQEEERRRKLKEVREGAGLAIKLIREQCGYQGEIIDTHKGETWREMRDSMYDSMIEEMEARCGSTPDI